MKRNIIVIGASAGGFEPLKEIIAGLPADLDASVFIVWHMSPDVTGILPRVLNKSETLHASNALDGEAIQPGHVYVAPPDHHLLIEDGHLRITHGPKENRFRPAIDPLFRSAAYAYGARVIGVILSGALDDGASGLWTIRQAGGLTIVQDPADAGVSSMPEAALHTGAADHCVPAAEIAALLTRLSQQTVQASGLMNQQEQVKAEIAIAAENRSAALELFKTGKLTAYTCPECGGVLAQLLDGDRPRYRCHTGHAFTPDGLMAAIAQMVEEGFYKAIRSLEESVMLLNHFGDHFAEANEPKLAAAYFRKAKEGEAQMTLVRRALETQEPFSKETIAAEAAAEASRQKTDS